jgi:hypothetical protein
MVRRSKTFAPNDGLQRSRFKNEYRIYPAGTSIPFEDATMSEARELK